MGNNVSSVSMCIGLIITARNINFAETARPLHPPLNSSSCSYKFTPDSNIPDLYKENLCQYGNFKAEKGWNETYQCQEEGNSSTCVKYSTYQPQNVGDKSKNVTLFFCEYNDGYIHRSFKCMKSVPTPKAWRKTGMLVSIYMGTPIIFIIYVVKLRRRRRFEAPESDDGGNNADGTYSRDHTHHTPTIHPFALEASPTMPPRFAPLAAPAAAPPQGSP